MRFEQIYTIDELRSGEEGKRFLLHDIFELAQNEGKSLYQRRYLLA